MSADKSPRPCPFCHGAKYLPSGDPKWVYACACNIWDKSPPRLESVSKLYRERGLLPAVPTAVVAMNAGKWTAEQKHTARHAIVSAIELLRDAADAARRGDLGEFERIVAAAECVEAHAEALEQDALPLLGGEPT